MYVRVSREGEDMQVTLTNLRSHLYQWIDQLIKTGEPIEIMRHGTHIKIIVEKQEKNLTKTIIKRTGVYSCDPDELASIDWSSEWRGDDDLS